MLGIVLIVMYFVPTIIAIIRQHRNGVPVALLNLFLGWTVIGWIIALIWSTTDNTHQNAAPDED